MKRTTRPGPRYELEATIGRGMPPLTTAGGDKPSHTFKLSSNRTSTDIQTFTPKSLRFSRNSEGDLDDEMFPQAYEPELVNEGEMLEMGTANRT